MKNVLFLVLLALGSFINAQDEDYPYPSLSPEGNIAQVVGNTKIELTYERPSARNRKIFGGLVPWNKVWRTGAGKCTRISFDKSIMVQGQPIPAGMYSVFTIPTPDDWVVIINADTTLYGHYNYDKQKDLARFSIPAKKTSRYYETLNFDIEVLRNDAKFYLSWANTRITFDIETTTDEEILRLINTELVTGKSKVSQLYAGAASYLYFQEENYPLALKLADKALQLNPENTWVYNTKISIYKKMKSYDEVLITIDQAIEGIRKRSYGSEKERLVDIDAYKARYKYFEELKH